MFRFVRKGETIAASGIYQSMKAICKLYEEWMEVMEDYATVFSSDSAVPKQMQDGDPSQSVSCVYMIPPPIDLLSCYVDTTRYIEEARRLYTTA